MTGNVRNVKVQLWNKAALLSSEGEQLVKSEFQNCDSLEMLGPLFVARQQSSVIMLPRLSSRKHVQSPLRCFLLIQTCLQRFPVVMFHLNVISGDSPNSAWNWSEADRTFQLYPLGRDLWLNSQPIWALLFQLRVTQFWPFIWGRAMVGRSAWVCDGRSQRRPRRLALTWFFHVLTFVSKCIFISQC